MKWFHSILMAVVIAATVITAHGQGSASLTVTIDNVANSKGVLKIGLFDKEEGFPVNSKAMAGKDIPAAKGKVSVEFKNLAPGDYAVAVYHDENINGKLDKNFIGAPKEGFGFSRDAKGFMSHPKYEDAVFEVEGEEVSLVVRLRY